MHKCCVCNAEAHFGYGVFLLGAGHWACLEHRREAEARAKASLEERDLYIWGKPGSGQQSTIGHGSLCTPST